MYINPRPKSVGLQIEGVDITMNGNLNRIPLEPPNPAICVGNGFVMEVTNDVSLVGYLSLWAINCWYQPLSILILLKHVLQENFEPALVRLNTSIDPLPAVDDA